MYTREPPYKLFFIILTLQETLVIRPTKKLVAIYIVCYKLKTLELVNEKNLVLG